MRRPHPATLGPSPGPWVRADAIDGLLGRTVFEDRSPADPELPADIDRAATEAEAQGRTLTISHYRLRRDGTLDGPVTEALRKAPHGGWSGPLSDGLPRGPSPTGWGRSIRHALVGALMPAGQRPRWWRPPQRTQD